MTPQFTPEAADDAVRDAAAVLRACLQDDTAAASVVAAHMTSPALTALVLARWLTDLTTAENPPAEALAALDDWQQRVGLS